MTVIEYASDGQRVKLSLKGHAEYASKDDIVCAAVSTLTYTLINFLDDRITEGKIKDLGYYEAPGDIEIEFEIVDYPEWPQICEFILTGYEMISEHYPDNVTVKRWDTLFCGM